MAIDKIQLSGCEEIMNKHTILIILGTVGGILLLVLLISTVSLFLHYTFPMSELYCG